MDPPREGCMPGGEMCARGWDACQGVGCVPGDGLRARNKGNECRRGWERSRLAMKQPNSARAGQ